MDPVQNPYAPGAGSPPPELAGRDELRRIVRIALQRIRIGNPAKSVLMVGLRGVGKTVLLERIRVDTEADGMQTVRMEAPEGRSLPALLAPQLRVALLRLSRVEAAKDVAKRGLSALRVLPKRCGSPTRTSKSASISNPNRDLPITAIWKPTWLPFWNRLGSLQKRQARPWSCSSMNCSTSTKRNLRH